MSDDEAHKKYFLEKYGKKFDEKYAKHFPEYMQDVLKLIYISGAVDGENTILQDYNKHLKEEWNYLKERTAEKWNCTVVEVEDFVELLSEFKKKEAEKNE